MNKNNSFALWRWNTMIMPDVAYLQRRTLFSFTTCFVWKFWQLQSRRIHFPGPTFASRIICHRVWPVASLKNSSGFPMASKVHLIAYQPINNEERGLYRRVMAEALSPALWKQKQCTLQNILETSESCSLLHLHSIKDLEQKGKN